MLDLVPTGMWTHVVAAFRWPLPLQTHTTAVCTQAAHEKSSMDEGAGDTVNRHCICQTYGQQQAGMMVRVAGLA